MNSPDPAPDEYQLGTMRIKAKENILVTDSGEKVVLPKVMSLLIYLCQHSQQVVTFDELCSAIWPREVVGDNAIYNLVGQLRKALGDNASSPIYIQTISKVGYRLMIKAVPATPQQKSESLPPQTEPKYNKLKWQFVAVFCALFVSVIWYIAFKAPNVPQSQESQRQLQLAYYQLYRGDGDGVDQAIDTLQQLIVIDPTRNIAKIELAYAFIRKARNQPADAEFWINKASAISADAGQGEEGKRLAAIITATNETSNDTNTLKEAFSKNNILNSAHLAYSDLLFAKGKTRDAAEQAKWALDSCMDCPYAYRKYATTQLVLGNVEEGFKLFSQYRMLVNNNDKNPADINGYIPLTLHSLKDMVNWYSHTPPPTNLREHQRNNLALFYLTLGQVEKADAIVNSTPTSATGFFELYTHAAIAGAKGDMQSSYQLLKKRQTSFPDNDRFKLSVVYALWQLGRYNEAMQEINKHHILPQPESIAEDSLPEIMPFNTWSLYAALLLKTQQAQLAERILAKLEKQLKTGTLAGRQTADIGLASVLALQGKKQQAIAQLEIAIKQGWVSDFNQNWWYLQDSPYFRNLKDDEEFKRIVAGYHESIEREITSLNTD